MIDYKDKVTNLLHVVGSTASLYRTCYRGVDIGITPDGKLLRPDCQVRRAVKNSAFLKFSPGREQLFERIDKLKFHAGNSGRRADKLATRYLRSVLRTQRLARSNAPCKIMQ